MGFVAALLAYLGTVTAVIVGLLMGFTVFFTNPGEPTAPAPTLAIQTLAMKSNKLAVTAPARQASPEAAGRWGPRVAPPAQAAVSITRATRLAKQAARERAARRVVELQRDGRFAYQRAPYQQSSRGASEPSYGALRGALGFAENSDAERGW